MLKKLMLLSTAILYCSSIYCAPMAGLSGSIFNCEYNSLEWRMTQYDILEYSKKKIRPRKKENKCDEIIRRLYIGGNSSVAYCVKHDLVDRIISFNPHGRHIVPKNYKGSFLTIKKRDNPYTKIADVFSQAYMFTLTSKKGVLIHCAKGHSRSAALCILLIMRRFHVPYEQARHYVRLRRPSVGPNIWFRKELKRLNRYEMIY